MDDDVYIIVHTSRALYLVLTEQLHTYHVIMLEHKSSEFLEHRSTRALNFQRTVVAKNSYGREIGYPEHEVLWITDFELHANSFATIQIGKMFPWLKKFLCLSIRYQLIVLKNWTKLFNNSTSVYCTVNCHKKQKNCIEYLINIYELISVCS